VKYVAAADRSRGVIATRQFAFVTLLWHNRIIRDPSGRDFDHRSEQA
jgi:hypothetical protein